MNFAELKFWQVLKTKNSEKEFFTGKKSSMKFNRAVAFLLLSLICGGVFSAELVVDDGVVIKFGGDAQLVVRDKITAGKGVVLTAVNDDDIAGPLKNTSHNVDDASWRGVRIEKSAESYAAFTIDDWLLRYAGNNTAAITVNANNVGFNNLQITDSEIGLKIKNGVAPVITGPSFLRNKVGVVVEDASIPKISGGQFVGNTQYAVNNLSPEHLVLANNMWWGHSTGPRNITTSPGALGDFISDGVNYSGYLTSESLLNPVARLADPQPFYSSSNVLINISCVNAIEYRISEDASFAGVPFTAMNLGRAQVSFQVSEGDGRKNIRIQFRNKLGLQTEIALLQNIVIDTQIPLLDISNPADGSFISSAVDISATASDASGINKVEFFVDDALKANKVISPYVYHWDNDFASEGTHVIRVVATDNAGRTNEKTSTITLTRAPVLPDTDGPVVGNFSIAGVALADGVVFTRNESMSVSVSDRSGVSRIELLLNGTVVTSASSSGTLLFSIDNIANGDYQLTLRVTDSLGNSTSQGYSIKVSHVAPLPPVFTQPANDFVTRGTMLTVIGSAKAGTNIQLIKNGLPYGSLIITAANGQFNAIVELTNGLNQIQANASDMYGTSAPSNILRVTLDTSVPAAPDNLVAQSQTGGKVKLSWVKSTDLKTVGYYVYRSNKTFAITAEASKLNGSLLALNTYEDLPPADGEWLYRVVAVNNLGGASLPSNLATAVTDVTAPKIMNVVYNSSGKKDPATGAFGQGLIDVQLTLSEKLSVLPYFAVVPHGGAPVTVLLTQIDDIHYHGSFSIVANTPSGIANTLFSARDAAGNRGTEISQGATFAIDTLGPEISNIVLTPSAPIDMSNKQPVSVKFTYNKAPAVYPQIKYKLTGQDRIPVAISNLNMLNETTYVAEIDLPNDAGLNGPETLSFTQVAQDALDNIATRIYALNQYQVYQGDLPPLEIPYGLTANPLPAGKVALHWQEVAEASAYQIYRKLKVDSELQALTRSANNDFVDQTPADGDYQYAVETIRQSNGQESMSGKSAIVDVAANATAPGAPQNLSLTLTGKGIYAAWLPPLNSQVDYYNLYRSTGTSINSIEGLTPLKTRVKTPQTYDTNPSPTAGVYVVTAVDTVGNESVISNSVYLNASLLPVRNLVIQKANSEVPKINWDAPNGNMAGYLVYVMSQGNPLKLTPSPISTTQFTDTGYTLGERSYVIATVDANGIEMPRNIVLPDVSTHIVSGLPIKRGIMNKLMVQITNTSSSDLSGVRAVLHLPIDKNATNFKDHKSEIISLGANETRLVSVIVGGYAELPSAPTAQIGVEIAAAEGELVKINRNQILDVTEGSLVIGMGTEEFTRGATGKVKLNIENTSDVDIEILTATKNGTADSTELRFKILDADGNILAILPYKQVFGAGVVTLTNGQSVARIPAGSTYTSDVFDLNIPASSPNNIRVQLEVDKMRYHTGQEDEIQITGRGSERVVTLLDTSYVAELSDITPVNSFGDQDILITGKALERATQSPMPNTRVKLVFNQQGFERVFSVLTDSSGNFKYTFKPTISDAGLFKVRAVHPDITDRPEQKAFNISRVTVGPQRLKLDVPKNYSSRLPLVAKAGAGTTATNLRLILQAASQPTGLIPEGISIVFPAPVNLSERQSLNVPVTFTANNDAQTAGSLVFDVVSDEHPLTPLGQVRVDYTLSEAKPYVSSTPAYIETGLGQGGSQSESITFKNNGLQEALNLTYRLTNADGSAAPAWASITGRPDGTLAVGESRTFDLNFSPPPGVPEGVYEMKININGDNMPTSSVNVYVSLTQSGQGNVLFKTSDIYTGTLDKNAQIIPGLKGATVTLQNEEVATVSHELLTDAYGEAMFQDLPTGRYKFRVKANNHQEVGGRLVIKPGITATQPVFLQYNLITVEWSVREITIEDRYEITLNTTFETDVPAAVVVMQPASVNLPRMAVGDVYYGEITLTNFGLIRADNVKQHLPTSDGYFRFEFLNEVPASLEAKQRVTLPYRVIALQSIDDAASNAAASGGGCGSYINSTDISCSFECAGGNTASCGSSTSFFAPGSGGCGGGANHDPIWIIHGNTPGHPGGIEVPMSPGNKLPVKGKKCVYIPQGGENGGTQCD